jgi:predicted O-methyltransferase YrrM
MEHFYHALEGECWFDYEDVYRAAVANAVDGSVLVEVGSWRGKSACFMAVEIINSGKNISFYCIDDWSQGDTMNAFLTNTAPVKDNINLIVSKSWDAAFLFEDNSIDFCFIDASHDYDSKVKDIKAFLPKMKPDGFLCGHDYTPEMDGYNRTYDAVNDTIGKDDIYTVRNVWIRKITI